MPGSATRGVLVLIGAIMQDATSALARIERQVAAAPDDVEALRHGMAAVAAVDRASRLLQTQRETLVERLIELAVEAAEPAGPGPRRLEAVGSLTVGYRGGS